MSKLCAKDFTEYVEVETKTETADGYGGYDTVWANKTFLWCKVEDKSGGEPFTNGRLETTTSTEFTTQYRDDITTLDRLILDGITYNITRVVNLDRKSRYLKVYGDSGVAS
mgnify:CR=1 FL=1